MRVARTYYTLQGLTTLSASLIWGVNTLFLLDAGLTVFQAFAATAAFTAGQVIFEVPTGVVADTRGRQLSFLLGAATLLAGTAAYVILAAMGATFIWWIAASVLLGLGFTFLSGATEAWFVDALEATEGEQDLDPYFARTGQVTNTAMLIGTVSGGLLGQLSLSLPYIVRSGLLLAMFAAGWFLMRDVGFDRRPFNIHKVPAEINAIGRASWEHGWKHPRVRLLMMLSFLHMGFLIWGWYAWQPYFLELLGQNAVWVAGVVAALVSVAMMAGNQLVRTFQGKTRRATLLVIGSTGFALAMLGVGLATTFTVAVAALLAGMLFFGIVAPSKQAALHRLIPSKQRATIISFDGLLGSAGGVGSQLALAKLADARGFAAGYLAGGAALLLGVPIALLFRVKDR